jgi:hypothetical protein
MKKIMILQSICVLWAINVFAQSPVSDGSQKIRFIIDKVNRIEKLYVIPPERRDFMGSRGVQKFDYERLLSPEKRGENYIVSWRYRGEKLNSPVVLKFEYKLSVNPKEMHTAQFEYQGIKTGPYSWTFPNVGADYTANGKVDRWKVSLLVDGVLVSEKRSSTWRAMEGT